MITEKQILGAAQKGSPLGLERVENSKKAEKSKETKDFDSLWLAYERSILDRIEMEDALVKVNNLLSEKKFPNEMHAIIAIKEVALAALSLAREISMKGK